METSQLKIIENFKRGSKQAKLQIEQIAPQQKVRQKLENNQQEMKISHEVCFIKTNEEYFLLFNCNLKLNVSVVVNKELHFFKF